MVGRYLSFEVTGARCAEDGTSFSKTPRRLGGEGTRISETRRAEGAPLKP
jgi:hypothetical protein